MSDGAVDIVSMEKRHIGDAASVLAQAFEEEPGAMAIIRGDRRKRALILRKNYAAQAAFILPRGLSKCAFVNGEMAGVMLASAPGKEAVTYPGMIKLFFRMLFYSTPAIMWRGWISLRDDENHRPGEPNYYLETIGVAPPYQGRGIGSALLSHLTGIADGEEKLVYLSTTDPKTVPLYEKHGFVTTSKTSPLGVTSFHMERKPRRS